MPTIRERFADLVLGDTARVTTADEVVRLREAFSIMVNAYEAGPWDLPPDELLRQLKEQDPWVLDDLLWQQRWELIGGERGDTDLERQRAMQESVRLYRNAPLAQWSIWLWTGWGLGDAVHITTSDEGAQPLFDEFWSADRNANVLAEDRIHELSNWLLLKGNRFLAYYASDIDGQTTARLLPDAEIVQIVTNPDDSSEPWFYLRRWDDGSKSRELYYPDWILFFSDRLDEAWQLLVERKSVGPGAKRADTQNSDNGDEMLGDEHKPGTVVCVQHVAFNYKEDASLWGWPLLTTARPWLRAHRMFMEARLTVAQAKAMFVRRKTVKGGSRAVNSVIGNIQSRLSRTQFIDTNPPASRGSVEVENQAIDTEDLPMTTGASDAKVDNDAFAWHALLGGGLFTTSAGLDTARWATALEMDKAQSMAFQRYQTFWSAQFRKMVKIVLGYAEKFGKKSFKTKDSDVSTDTFSLADFPQVARSVGQIVRDALTPLVDDGTIPADAANSILQVLWRINLNALGVGTAQELTSDEAFKGETVTEEDAVAKIAAVIMENAIANAGTGVEWQRIAEWALDTIADRFVLEGNDGGS